METSFALTVKLRPSNIRKDSKACMGLAWGNFDINLETLFEAESIYHTYVICYENIRADEEVRVSVDNRNDANKEYTEEFVRVTVSNRKRKIREISSSNSKDSLSDNLEPYFNYEYVHFSRKKYGLSRQLLGMGVWISYGHFYQTGWVSLRHEVRLQQQTVGYMKPITFP